MSRMEIYSSAVCVKTCPGAGDTPDCIPTRFTSCKNFAALDIGTQRVFTSCLPDSAADRTNAEIKKNIDEIEENF